MDDKPKAKRDRRAPARQKNPQRARRLKMTAERKQVFIDALAKYGVAEWAAVEASPGAVGSCIASFHTEKHRDPEFAEAWEAAYEVGRMRVVGEAYRRAVEGDEVIGRDGAPAGRRYSDSLMGLILKSKSMGSMFVDRQEVEHSGQVTTKRDLGIADLSPAKRELLRKLLEPEDDGAE